jgi:hypothetical protein
MTDEVNFDAAPEPAPKKKPAKKKAKRASPAAKKQPDGVPFPGLTRSVCAEACGAKGCVISGKSYCGHPCKGGLQAADLTDPAALKRLQLARAQIDVRIDPNRFQ